MTNPWNKLDLNIYESHMNFINIKQLECLSEIMKSQFYSYDVDIIGILGIAGGNGLEHISCTDFTRVYGIDINQKYLDVVKNRYPSLNKCLFLKNLDFNDLSIYLPKMDLIIANLFLEYLELSTFIYQIKSSSSKFVSCVLQDNNKNDFVSDSPYLENLKEISKFAKVVDSDDLIVNMKKIGYNLILNEIYELFNKKRFIRLDFEKI